MAGKPDQGLQIGLIFAVFFALIFAVATYIGFRSAGEAKQRADELARQKSDAESAQRNLQNENERYREMMGFRPVEDSLETVEKTFKEDMQRYAGTFDESRHKYREILEYIYEENGRIAQRESQSKEREKDLKERLAAVEAEKDAQVSTFRTEMQQTKEDIARETSQFKSDRAALESAKAKLLENLDIQRTKFEAELARKNAETTELNDKLAKNERSISKLMEERQVEARSFEVPDGRIAWVNQNGTVWINLGSADALRPQVTFSVYDTDQPDAANAEKKGSIEVTRILGEHMSEALVTADDARNPILSGDQIYSQVWHPGKQLRFAFTGFIDFDSDGRSDLQTARDLIALNGAEVDAYVDEKGAIQGQLSVETRYLVLGDRPTDVIKAAMSESYDRMGSDAAALGVETIGLDQFLNQMGYISQERTVALGPAARPSDFPASEDKGNTSDALKRATPPFRPRSPNLNNQKTPY
jgi:hypothetical protein